MRALDRRSLAVGLALLALAAPAGAQQGGSASRPTTTLTGIVVDAVRGDPLPNAIVVWDELNRGTLSDAEGRFVLSGVPLGAGTLAVKQYGYEEINLDLDVTAGLAALRVELTPGPIALEGFSVLADHLATMDRRLESRRQAWGGSVRSLDQARLTASGAFDALELLANTGSLHFVSCSQTLPARSFQRVARSAGEGPCISRRGTVTNPKVFIDEAPVLGGLGFLATFRPYELYLVEVYSGGAQIRAYTHWYMERMAKRPEQLFPLEI